VKVGLDVVSHSASGILNSLKNEDRMRTLQAIGDLYGYWFGALLPHGEGFREVLLGPRAVLVW
jgi:hypothetical protein